MPDLPHLSLSTRRRRLRPAAVVLCLLAALVVPLTAATTSSASPAPTAARAARPNTVVSLTFDDSLADQVPAEQTLKASGLAGTFYTVSGWVGGQGYLTRDDLNRFSADGMEIGGHTVTHQDLIQIKPEEAKRQICDDRATLQSWGFHPTDFAYPFSDSNTSTEQAAAACGYVSSRGLGDIRSPGSCSDCPYAESTPPADLQYLQAPDEVDSTWTLAQMEAEVTGASTHAGGWVILSFHHVCAPVNTAACPGDISTTPTIYNAFVKWLAGYAATKANATTVRTVDSSLRGYLGSSYPAYKNATTVPNNPPAAVGVNAVANPSLETANATTGFPDCFQAGGYGTNTVAWSKVAGHTGATAEQLTVSGYGDGDAKLLPNLDLGTCTPTITPGTAYRLGAWYKSTGTAQFALYYRDTAGNWHYWTSSPYVATASAWTQATWTTPAAPADAVGMSFGLALISNGTLQTDDYSAVKPGTGSARAAARPTASTRTRHHHRHHRRHHRVSHTRPYVPAGDEGSRIYIPEFGGHGVQG